MLPKGGILCLPYGRLQHESQRLLKEALEGLQPLCTDGTVHGSVVGRQSSAHDLDRLEALGVFRSKLELGRGSTDGEDARLRRVDDSGKVGDTEHAEVGDGERAALVLLGLELAVTSESGQRLGLGRDGSEALGAGVLDDGGDQSVGGGDGNADVGLFVSAKSASSLIKLIHVLPDGLTQPSRVGLGYLGQGEGGSLDDCAGQRRTERMESTD